MQSAPAHYYYLFTYPHFSIPMKSPYQPFGGFFIKTKPVDVGPKSTG